MAQFYRKKILLARADGAGNFVAADAVLATGVQLTAIAGDETSRELDRHYFGAQPRLLANTHQQLQFSVEFAPGGDASMEPLWGKFLKACGFSVAISRRDGDGTKKNDTVTYAPVTDNPDKVKLGLNQSGMLHTLSGARGTFTLELTSNAIPRFQFNMTGLWQAPAKAGLLAGDYSGWKAPSIPTKKTTPTVEIFGESNIPLTAFSFDCGSNLVHRSLVNASPEVVITGREPSATLTVDATDWDVFAAAIARTTGEVKIVHGAAGGQQITLTMPTCEIGQGVSYQDNNGILQRQIPLVPLPSAGNDEVEIKLQ